MLATGAVPAAAAWRRRRVTTASVAGGLVGRSTPAPAEAVSDAASSWIARWRARTGGEDRPSTALPIEMHPSVVAVARVAPVQPDRPLYSLLHMAASAHAALWAACFIASPGLVAALTAGAGTSASAPATVLLTRLIAASFLATAVSFWSLSRRELSGPDSEGVGRRLAFGVLVAAAGGTFAMTDLALQNFFLLPKAPIPLASVGLGAAPLLLAFAASFTLFAGAPQALHTVVVSAAPLLLPAFSAALTHGGMLREAADLARAAVTFSTPSIARSLLNLPIMGLAGAAVVLAFYPATFHRYFFRNDLAGPGVMPLVLYPALASQLVALVGLLVALRDTPRALGAPRLVFAAVLASASVALQSIFAAGGAVGVGRVAGGYCVLVLAIAGLVGLLLGPDD